MRGEMDMSSKIYIVTGAAGFLGGTVCRQLLECGEKVRAFVLPNDPAAKYIPDGAEVVYGDLCNRESIEKLFTVPEGMKSIVLHIASIVTVDPAYSQKVIDVNVGGRRTSLICALHILNVKSWSIAAARVRSPKPRREAVSER